MELRDRLIKARKSAGLSQEELAYRVGCTQGAISKIERGDQKTTHLLIKIAEICKVNANWLDSGTGEMHADISYDALSSRERIMLKIMQELPEDKQDVLIRIGGTLHEPQKKVS